MREVIEVRKTDLLDFLTKKGKILPDKIPSSADAKTIKDTAKQLAQLVHEICGDPNKALPISNELSGKMSLSEIIEKGGAVCRHRSLLYQVLAYEIGLNVRTVKGSTNGGNHAWNEIILPSGEIMIVDNMNPERANPFSRTYKDLEGNVRYNPMPFVTFIGGVK